MFTESGVFPEFQEAKRVKDAEVAKVRAATARKKEAIKEEWDANIERAVAEKLQVAEERKRAAARRAQDMTAAADAPGPRATAGAWTVELWHKVLDAAKPAKMRGETSESMGAGQLCARVCVCMRACVQACVACVHCVRACMHALRACVHACVHCVRSLA